MVTTIDPRTGVWRIYTLTIFTDLLPIADNAHTGVWRVDALTVVAYLLPITENM